MIPCRRARSFLLLVAAVSLLFLPPIAAEVFFNGTKVGGGYYDRPEGKTGFRWGMYDKTLKHDAMILVTGATFK